MASTKNIIVELNKEMNLNIDNYKVLNKHVYMVLVEQKPLDHIKKLMKRPNPGITNQHNVFNDE